MPSKYRAVKTKIDGITFASKTEAARYYELRLLEKAGQVSALKLQPSFELVPAYTTRAGEKIRPIVYRADFQYFDKNLGITVVEDVKGMKTTVYKIKRKLLLWRYPEINFIES